MAVLCWMAVTLALLQSAGNSLADVDQNQLASIVNVILNRYRPSYQTLHRRKSPMFSLAVSIPYNINRKMYDINQVFNTDPGNQVKNSIQACKVYTGTRVVAATLLKWLDVLNQCPDGRVEWTDVVRRCGRRLLGIEATWANVQRKCPDAVRGNPADHAEYRSLQHFNTLVNNHNKNDLLLFYVYASPCASRCAQEGNPRSILKLINPILNWDNFAFVFSKVFRPREGDPIPEEDLQGALLQLGNFKGDLGSIGLNNIFRCDRTNDKMQCTSCSTGGQVTRRCYLDEPQPGPSHPHLPSALG